MAVKAMLFDLGDTLYTYDGLPLSWQGHYLDAWSDALTAVGLDPGAYNLRLAASHMEKFNTRLVAREREFDADHIFGGALVTLGIDGGLRDGIVDAFFGHFRQSLRPYPETGDVLSTLRCRGIKTGALTDVAYGMPDRFVEDDLRQTGLLNLLDLWRTSVQIGYRKPHPQGFLCLCKDLNVLPAEAAYVGNEEKDIVGAKNAGLRAVLIDRQSSGSRHWGQDKTIADLSGCLDEDFVVTTDI
ncbi:HAD family hydrolase [Telmatospirillum sp.]|uniref:HAD family hydrolase n=1 Tax=Telmatospirillum sp. TaxID=2079197 RepID=UPI002849D141|nr:HAD family hydrolase [Telmatospirillum sp.]MDR3438139.1 HAD family hydrolase [Telmatospirillum sp.]